MVEHRHSLLLYRRFSLRARSIEIRAQGRHDARQRRMLSLERVVMLRQVLNSGGYVYAFIVGVAENRIGGRNPKDRNRDQAAGQ